MKLKSASGKLVHPVGIGTWGVGGMRESAYDEDEAGVSAIRYSLSKGQNHIDSAQMYGGGHTDEIVGQAIRGLNRQDIFLADKLWETSVASGKVRPAVKEMLRKLGTDYLDALYIHKPWDDVPWREAIPQINELIDTGIVRYFGVSNFDLDQTKETVRLSKHPIALSQLHYSVTSKDALGQALRKFCEDNGIQIFAYRPLERGEALTNETVQAIAGAHRATPAQIALAWLLARGTSPIPKTTKEQRIDENLGALDIQLSVAEIERLDSL